MGLGLLLYIMSLDCHVKVEMTSYMAPPATNIIPNYLQFYFRRWFWHVCLFCWLQWDNRKTKQNAIAGYWSPSCLTNSPIWVAISCQCQIVIRCNSNPCLDDSLMYSRTRIAASQWGFCGVCIYWLRVRTENTMSGQAE